MGKDTIMDLGGGTYSVRSLNAKTGMVISAKAEDSAKPATKQGFVDGTEDGNTDKWQNWGADNLWPTRVRKIMEASTVAAPLVFKAVCQMYGTGLTYWVEKREADKITKDFSEIPEVEEFLENNNVDYIALERMMDFKYFNNLWNEFIFNHKFTKIVETNHLEGEFCRVSQQNEKSHEFEFIGFLGNWETPDLKKVEKIPNIDWKRKSVNDIFKAAKSKNKFAVHSKFPSPGRPIYGAPAHQALYNNKGWLTYSNRIPRILNAMLDNGMKLKYHIQIPSSYWKSVYDKWQTYSEEKKTELKKAKLEEMHKWLTGDDSSMSSFISEFATDKVTGKKLPGWEITEIKDSSTLDKEIISSQESDSHISRALGIDPSLAGLQPQGGKMGAGSGSDKRTAFQNAISMSKAEQLVVLDFLYVIGKVNKWPKGLKWGFQHEIPTTLNEDKSGKTDEV